MDTKFSFLFYCISKRIGERPIMMEHLTIEYIEKIKEVINMGKEFGFSNNFALLVVLFILLIIIGAAYIY